ncbi:hypothetical protein JXR93_13960 [bacterium]|nr:hypothetical protein [bacterium]
MSNIFLFFIVFFAKLDTSDIDNYLKQWLNKEDYVFLFNPETKEEIYQYNKKNISISVPIGSITKIWTTFVALKRYPHLKNHTHNCQHIEGENRCWDKKGHGILNFREAFANSCNQFFNSIAEHIEFTVWFDELRAKGVFLNISYNNFFEKDKQSVFRGDNPKLVANGFDLAWMIYIVYNEGKAKDLTFSEKEINVLKTIKSWMRDVVLEGTVKGAKYKPNSFSGKTGTATDENGRYYGVFIGFINDPPLAIVVSLKDRIGSNASWIASDLFYFFTKRDKKIKKKNQLNSLKR